MSKTVIKIENLSKVYRLGQVGTGTLSHDLNRWFKMNILGKEDPYAKVGGVNDRTQKAEKGELVAALRDINLEVKEGEVLGIIGKNGAGKSTLLKLLSRVTSPTTGCIKVKGRMASLLEVGTGFHPEMTGRENIYMNGTIMGMRKWEIDRKLDEIVDFAGVAKYLDTPTKRYSSGMTVRLGFAIAAHLEPEILVVDEVLAVGDAEFQKKAIGKMQDVSSNEGRTVLFVSHNMASIQTLCSKGIILKNGSLLEEGQVNKIIQSYLSDKIIQESVKYINTNDKQNKIAWITEAYIGEGNRLTNDILCGQNLPITIKYKASETNINASLFIGIYNSYGDKILHLGTLYNNKIEIFKTKKEGTVSCTIPRIPLTPGQYSINLAFYINGQAYDKVPDALSFNVENGDFYGNGKLPNSKENKFLVDQNWVIE